MKSDVFFRVPECFFVCYADNIKIFLPISSTADCTVLQGILVRFSPWCNVNSFTLWTDKCNTISFTCSRSPIAYPYNLNSELVNRVNVVKDP